MSSHPATLRTGQRVVVRLVSGETIAGAVAAMSGQAGPRGSRVTSVTIDVDGERRRIEAGAIAAIEPA